MMTPDQESIIQSLCRTLGIGRAEAIARVLAETKIEISPAESTATEATEDTSTLDE